MSETRALYAVPELAKTEPTLEIYITPIENLLLKTSVAELCLVLEDNLPDMEHGDFARIESLYRLMVYQRDQQLKTLPLFAQVTHES